MKNNLRIQKICDQINNSRCVIDIGSDHAFLSINLIKQNKAHHVVNVEKNKMPLENGIQNIASEGLLKKTTNILSDGFTHIEKKWDFDYCVMSGFGDKTMKKILKQKKPKIRNYVFVPNNNPFSLRKYLLTFTNQKIIHEEIIVESNVFYFLIKTKKSLFKQLPTYKNCLFGPININKKSKNFIDFLQSRMNFIEKSSIANVNTKMKKELKIIKSLLNKNDKSKSAK